MGNTQDRLVALCTARFEKEYSVSKASFGNQQDEVFAGLGATASEGGKVMLTHDDGASAPFRVTEDRAASPFAHQKIINKQQICIIF